MNRRAKSGEEAKTDFFTVTAWRQTAEFITRFFDKGSSICVTGTLQNRSWNDKDGNKRTVTEILAEEVCFVDSRSDASQSAHQSGNADSAMIPGVTYVPDAYKKEESPKYEELEIDDGELPF